MFLVIEAALDCEGYDIPETRAVFPCHDTREVHAAFRHMRTDSMGRGIIVYFPGTEFVRDDADCEECDATVKIGETLCKECKAESLPAT